MQQELTAISLLFMSPLTEMIVPIEHFPTNIPKLRLKTRRKLTRIPISKLFVFYALLSSREKKRDIGINYLKIFESFQQQSFKLLLTVIVNKATCKILNFAVHFQERVQ